MQRAAAPRPGLRVAALSAAVLLLSTGGLMVGQRAWALWVDVPQTGQPGYLSLASAPYPADFPDLSPGDAVHWQIRVDLNDEHADVTLQMAREGALVERQGGLLISATACSEEWDLTAAPTCHGTRAPIIGPTDAADPALGPTVSSGATFPDISPVWDVGWMSSGSSAFVLVTLMVPDTPQSRADVDLMGLESSIDFAFSAFASSAPPPGEGPPQRTPVDPSGPTAPTPGVPETPGIASPPNELALTGADVGALALIAAGALWLGGLAFWGGRRTAQERGRA